MPNTFEVFANVTNGHWYLSLLLFLVIIAKPAKHVLGHVYDAAIIVLASLSGPFVLFLLPISAIYYYKHRTKRLLYILLGVALFSFIQGILIVSLSEQDRIQTELGASLMLLIQIISGQVFTASLIGQSGYGRVYEAFLKEPNIFATIFSIVTFLIGMATLAYTSIKAQLEIKLFLLFGVFVSAASLYSPMISRTSSQWPIMVLPGAGTRYWFLPMLAFVMSLVFLIKKQNPIYARVIGAMLFVVLLYGMKADFHKPHFEPRDYAAHVETFEALPIGEAYKIPIYPVGWDMVLIKK